MSRAFRLHRRISSVVVGLLFVWRAQADAATLLDPALRFQVIRTEHFFIYFHRGEERLAQRLATIAEDVWPRVGVALGVAAPKRTHVILADQSELANGWAAPIPYNTVFVTAAAPAGSDFIGRADDWMRLVFTHEFTHIVHLDRSEGWSRVFRGIFGRTPIAFPNLWLPQWQIEGLAAWEESQLTGEGRRYAADFRAIERETARAGQRPRLDRINGGLIDWPGGLAPYAFGLGFHEYMAERFGESRFADLAKQTSRSIPFLGSRAFRKVYGESLGSLWRGYTNNLSASSNPENTPNPENPPNPENRPNQLTHQGNIVLGPRFAPATCASCPPEIIYSARNPHGFPSLRSVGTDGAGDRHLTTRYLGSTVGIGQNVIVFDQQEVRRGVGLYSDLYLFDRLSGDVKRLTDDARLQDPDLSPAGDAIVAVRQNGDRRDLVLVRLKPDPAHADVESGFSRTVTEISILVTDPDTQFNAPRWSPDGQTIAVERHRLGAESEIVAVTLQSHAVRQIAVDARARLVTPAWRADGKAIVAAADFGDQTFNLYEFDVVDPTRPPRQLTHMTGGAIWPDLSRDGETIAFAGYTATGFDVFTTRYEPEASPIAISRSASNARQPIAESRSLSADAYSSWRTLPPTSWSPVVEADDQVRSGFATAGFDVLRRHSYAAAATWLVTAPDGALIPDSKTIPDWYAAYAYERWVPSFFVSGSSATEFAAGPVDDNGRPTPATRRAREVQAGIFFPFAHVRSSQRVIASLLRGFDDYVLQDGSFSANRGAARLGVATNSSHEYGYSISSEAGVRAGATAEIVRRGLGSPGDAATFTADVRAYFPGPGRHHVVAVRAAGGTSTGDARFTRIFLLGGSAPNPDVLDFGREAISQLRGFPLQEFAGTRVAIVSADYRFPIAWPQRGRGTWPLFLQTVHAAVTADAGHAWEGTFDRRSVKTSVGAELSFEVVAGYVFPFTAALGSAWGHDGATRDNAATFYLRFGRAF